MKAIFATDLSEASETAIENRTCLDCLERAGVDQIHLVTVLAEMTPSGLPGFDLRERQERVLKRQRKIFEDAGFEVETHVLRGTPHRRINGLAEQVDADLIVVGSRGEGSAERGRLGGTARNVARTAVRPLLVERIVESEEGHEVARKHLFERVLYATDFSENAERAFDQFERLQDATQEAMLVHVEDSEQRERAGGPDPQERLDELADRLAEMGIDAETSVRSGHPVEEILAAAEEFEPTTILMGARGLSPMRRLLIGSVSEKVTARANSNVLVVPPSRMR
jgi:nucleotide-binding universal stress UspA family protein